MKVLKLSRAATEWLVCDSGLECAPVSPVAFLRGKAALSPAEARAAAAREELTALGVAFDGTEPRAEATPFRRAL
ncbi:MAG TPA: hypothetical protein VFO85_07980, partial [Vicinamibacteria bacterium]|nr:hypothetical protein [Vicinamibacteria bacterium]